MKRTISFLILVFLCFSLCACGQSEADKAKLDEAANTIKAAAGIDCSVELSKGGYLSIVVGIPESDDLAFFGTRAYHVINTVRDLFPEDNDFVLRINKETSIPKYQGKDYIYVTASGAGKFFCRYFDNRESVLWYNQQKDCETVDDLAKFFPQLQIRLKEERNLTPDELAIWDEVWSKLDAEPDRDEMEIFDEIGPDYEMTGEEMKTFIDECMAKVYD